jgi:hypothetical protein
MERGAKMIGKYIVYYEDAHDMKTSGLAIVVLSKQ